MIKKIVNIITLKYGNPGIFCELLFENLPIMFDTELNYAFKNIYIRMNHLGDFFNKLNLIGIFYWTPWVFFHFYVF